MTTVDGVAAPRARPKGAGIDPIFKAVSFAAAIMLLAALGGILITLALGGSDAFAKYGLNFFITSRWDPVADIYGAAGPIIGTLVTSVLALVLALPLAFGIAVFLVEFCPVIVRRPIGIAVELLAGVPSIVYGIWGLFVFAPFFALHIQLPLMTAAPPGSVFAYMMDGTPNGINIMTASIILAIMILPFMAAVLRELFLTVPPQLRESGYGMGSTSLEVIMSITLPYVRRSAVGAAMLGLGRALGETMAVTFVIGNSHALPTSLFQASSTIASTIANEFNEATGLQKSALLAIGLVLFVMTFGVLAIARALLGSDKNA